MLARMPHLLSSNSPNSSVGPLFLVSVFVTPENLVLTNSPASMIELMWDSFWVYLCSVPGHISWSSVPIPSGDGVDSCLLHKRTAVVHHSQCSSTNPTPSANQRSHCQSRWSLWDLSVGSSSVQVGKSAHGCSIPTVLCSWLLSLGKLCWHNWHSEALQNYIEIIDT